MSDRIEKSCSYIRLQGALYLLAFLTFSVGDGITSLWMMEQRGIMGEANPLARYLLINYGSSGFMILKLWFGLMVLFVPFLIQRKSFEPVYWMVNGYLLSFIIAGTLASILNMQAAMNRDISLAPGDVILIFLSSVLLLTQLGEEIDRRTSPKAGGYLDCARNDIMTALIYLIKIFSRQN